jgi:hypothetical protein
MAWLAPCLCIELSSVLPLNYVPSVVRRLGLNSGSCVAYLLERNQTLSLPIPCRCSLRGVGRTMKSSMCPTAASLRCVVVVDHVGVLVLSVAEHNVGSGLSLPFSTQHKLSRLKRTIAVPVYEHVRP